MAEPLPESESELLWRHVDPKLLDPDSGVISSQAFRPKPSDHGEMSVDLGKLTSAKDSFEFFTGPLKGHSLGAYEISTAACATQGLRAYSKPKTDEPPNPAHGIVDFNPHKEKQWRGKGQRLRDKSRRAWPAAEVPPSEPGVPGQAAEGQKPQ